MSHTIRARAVALAVMLTVGAAPAVFAQTAKPAKAAKASSSMASHTVSGTLEKFDTSGQMLTVRTSKGSETLALGTDAKIHQGSHNLTAADLASQTGSHVSVQYTEQGGQKTAKEVRLSGKQAAAAKPKK